MKLAFDPSALVKRYLDERGRDAVQQLLAQATQVAVAAHCKAEIVSAFARNQHDGVMAPNEVQRLVGLVHIDFEDFERVELDRRVETLTLALLLRHRLRAMDALHVAAAQQAAADLFITADRRQAEAAAASGLKTQLIEA
ncbi:type II toxin-antitoxin system VapC family toxin [Inhella proteolytica]|uniref:Type II toxin-antitoxin system VapC family toxin n=1 Tax=Inhella proteolytica TaxID=2795029 RepID=A0A931NJX9_9BURK|nr:type II toxin-antitoxin system VapC family toxin [Inhella proteolytica]MBH9579439.1 type II toxin-antitoxin system VapC family toxin [Inhella proteolytica]